ncbi:MAG: hypothetical protein E7607_00845 [Ruminococcaceae bacterium]|nr:hypothetical protein [Oscillospiraceae bacterium]
MKLVSKRNLDQKNRVFIPKEYITAAGGIYDGECYITFDEDTKKIEILFPSALEMIEKSESSERR